jgi:hypothetical protein
MAFTLYLSHQDLARIAANVKQAVTDHRPHAEEIWRGGLDNWTNSPLASADKQQGDASVRAVSISVGRIEQLQQLLRLIAARVLGAAYLNDIANDLPNHAVDAPGGR